MLDEDIWEEIQVSTVMLIVCKAHEEVLQIIMINLNTFDIST